MKPMLGKTYFICYRRLKMKNEEEKTRTAQKKTNLQISELTASLDAKVLSATNTK